LESESPERRDGVVDLQIDPRWVGGDAQTGPIELDRTLEPRQANPANGSTVRLRTDESAGSGAGWQPYSTPHRRAFPVPLDPARRRGAGTLRYVGATSPGCSTSAETRVGTERSNGCSGRGERRQATLRHLDVPASLPLEIEVTGMERWLRG
jgi:hypothetical protein